MIDIANEQSMRAFGEALGAALHGGEHIELVGDVGAGKTTLVRGIAAGLGINEAVQSPSFTINRVYDVPHRGLRLVHYDFYRLTDPGIMRDELSEALHDDATVIIIEWAGAVADVLPEDHLTIRITSTTESARSLELTASGERSERVKAGIA